MVADQGGEFKIVVASPETDFFNLLRREKAVVGVAPDKVGLFADCETMVPDL